MEWSYEYDYENIQSYFRLYKVNNDSSFEYKLEKDGWVIGNKYGNGRAFTITSNFINDGVLKFKIKSISCGILLSDTYITSFKNFPKNIDGVLNVHKAMLTSLQGMPNNDMAFFFNCYNLKDLTGAISRSWVYLDKFPFLKDITNKNIKIIRTETYPIRYCYDKNITDIILKHM